MKRLVVVYFAILSGIWLVIEIYLSAQNTNLQAVFGLWWWILFVLPFPIIFVSELLPKASVGGAIGGAIYGAIFDGLLAGSGAAIQGIIERGGVRQYYQ